MDDREYELELKKLELEWHKETRLSRQGDIQLEIEQQKVELDIQREKRLLEKHIMENPNSDLQNRNSRFGPGFGDRH